jgi:hypothetical protein
MSNERDAAILDAWVAFLLLATDRNPADFFGYILTGELRALTIAILHEMDIQLFLDEELPALESIPYDVMPSLGPSMSAYLPVLENDIRVTTFPSYVQPFVAHFREAVHFPETGLPYNATDSDDDMPSLATNSDDESCEFNSSSEDNN